VHNRYLHTIGVQHRDLKPGNVMVSFNGNFVLSDFGLATSKASSSASTKRTGAGVGTEGYMAPELYGVGGGKEVDLYAYGVLVWELFSGSRPFAGVESLKIGRLVEAGERPPIDPSTIPPAMQELVKACWRQDPRQRPTAADVVMQLANVGANGFPVVTAAPGGEGAAADDDVYALIETPPPPCAYSSKKGKCSRAAVGAVAGGGGRFCDIHTCPAQNCKEYKSSQATRCAHHTGLAKAKAGDDAHNTGLAKAMAAVRTPRFAF
jgi:serine/threonine protein kinase